MTVYIRVPSYTVDRDGFKKTEGVVYMKKRIAVVVLVTCAVFLLTACGGSSIVGKWKDEPTGKLITMDFKDDGTLKITTLSNSGTVNYRIDGDKIIMDNGKTWTFRLEGNKLTLTTDNDNSLDFVRE